ncbi:hypothetical protein E4U17_005719 [Claviceps sp. LM77 group G4]|nr:hypothetical protein E4U17_005719 [Claviceps sp. LM77 group G4]KAG6071843.1 hypothetical protein E4U16_005849 [Claviceps sp. LM84 group G4]
MLHETIGKIGSRGIEPLVNTPACGNFPRPPSEIALEAARAGDGWQGSGGPVVSVPARSPGEVVALSPAMPPMRLPLGGKREASGHLV